MTDQRTEHDPREFLVAREPVAAPARLRARVAGIPASERAAGGRIAGLRSIARIAAGLIVALGLGTLLVLRGQLGFGETAAPDPAVPPARTHLDGAGSIFSAEAIAQAERRLAAVSASWGVEATVIVREVPDRAALDLGQPFDARTYDHDGSIERDLVTVLGVDPDGKIVCCLSYTGEAISRLDHAWRPLRRIDQLTGRMQSPSQAVRDEALATYVGGVERLGPMVVADAAANPWRQWIQPIAIGLLLFIAAAWLGLRRRSRRRRLTDSPTTFDQEDIVATLEPVTVGTAVRADADSEAGRPAATDPVVSWVPGGRGEVLRERTIAVLVAAGAVLLAVLAYGEGLGLPSAGTPLDPALDGRGMIASSPAVSFPIVQLLLVGAIVLGGAWLVWRRGRVARIVGLVGALVVLWLLWSITRNGYVWLSNDPGSHAWADGLGYGSTETAEGLPTTVATYPVGPGESTTYSFTIRNQGQLPVTILGVGEEPWIGGRKQVDLGYRVTGLASVGSPTSGPVDLISARPEDAQVAWPVRLAPGERLVLVVVGQGGPCAAGSRAEESTSIVTTVRLVYRVAGWTNAEDVHMPVAVFVPTVLSDCSGETP